MRLDIQKLVLDDTLHCDRERVKSLPSQLILRGENAAISMHQRRCDVATIWKDKMKVEENMMSFRSPGRKELICMSVKATLADDKAEQPFHAGEWTEILVWTRWPDAVFRVTDLQTEIYAEGAGDEGEASSDSHLSETSFKSPAEWHFN